MSDTDIPPPPSPVPTPDATPAPIREPIREPVAPRAAAAPPPPPKPAKSPSRLWPLLGLVAIILLAAGELYLWRLHQQETAGATSQLTALQSQLASLQQAQASATQPAPDSVTGQADLHQKLLALTAQVNAMQTQLGADHGAITTLAANNLDITKLSAKIELLDKLSAARMALDFGQPVGALPAAPPALAKYATTAPPTQAALVLTYPKAAAAANDASATKANKGTIWSGALARIENLVTISNGDHVIIGAPAAAITAQAGAMLNAGDLAGAVATLTNGLSPTTQQAMGDWLIEAQSLVAARQAIIALSSQN